MSKSGRLKQDYIDRLRADIAKEFEGGSDEVFVTNPTTSESSVNSSSRVLDSTDSNNTDNNQKNHSGGDSSENSNRNENRSGDDSNGTTHSEWNLTGDNSNGNSESNSSGNNSRDNGDGDDNHDKNSQNKQNYIEMTTTPTATVAISFTDVKDSLKKFNTGSKNMLEKWINEFDKVAQTSKWNDVQKFLFALKLLEGEAAAVAETSDLSSYNELIESSIHERNELNQNTQGIIGTKEETRGNDAQCTRC